MRTRAYLVVPVVLGLFALGACSSETSSPTSNLKAANVAASADYSAIPETPYSLTPAERANLDFGILSSVTTTNGITTLHVDRTVFYQGQEAQAHGAGDSEEWITRDPDGEGKLLTFTLDPKASIQAEASLRNDHDAGSQIRENLTPAQLATNTTYVTSGKSDAGPTILVWLRHTGGPNGPVTALVDQFTP